jgi:hypothetical protein
MNAIVSALCLVLFVSIALLLNMAEVNSFASLRFLPALVSRTLSS